MLTPYDALIGLIVIAGVINLFLIFRPALTRERGGKILAFVGIFLLPFFVGAMALETHMENSKKTEFCLSCHVMQNYGKSLYVDDKEYIPAVHFQNHRVPKEMACFTCHTEYTLYGDYAAKLRGLRHLYYQYIGTIPDTIKLYEKYNNRECLHCHEESRSFEEKSIHTSYPGRMDSIRKNQMSCLANGCHDVAHSVKDINKADFWKPVNMQEWPQWMRDSAIAHPVSAPAPAPTSEPATTPTEVPKAPDTGKVAMK